MLEGDIRHYWARQERTSTHRREEWNQASNRTASSAGDFLEVIVNP